MEDVLEVYQRPHDPQRPLVCLDETSKQLIIETRAPIPAKPGRKARHDYEYERNGVANLFMVFAPLEGRRSKPSNGSSIMSTGCGVRNPSAMISRRLKPFDREATRFVNTGPSPTAETMPETSPAAHL